MKSKRKGFTLIELLAVIVVLAIIALITVPIILNLIEKARKGAFARSAENVLKSSKLYYSSGLLELEPPDDTRFECNNSECISTNLDSNGNPINLNINGNMGSGYVLITKEGEIEFKLQGGKYCASKAKDSEKITVKEENCESIDVTNDTTAPIIKSINTVVGTSTIEVIAIAEEDREIYGYEFSIDGTKWYPEEGPQRNSNVYTFENLTRENEPYTVYVRVYNGTYGTDAYTEEKGMSEGTKEGIELKLLETPTIIVSPEGWQKSKIVEIDPVQLIEYQSNNYIIEYSIDGGSYYPYTQAITFTSNGNITIRVSDGINSKTYTELINEIDILEEVPIVVYTQVDGSTYTSDTWTTSDVALKISPNGIGAEIDKYQVTYDGGTTFEDINGDTLTIDEEGIKNVQIKAIDKLGNESGLSDLYTVKIDKAYPEIIYSVLGGNYTEYQTITVSVSDVNYHSMAVHVYKNNALVYSDKVDSKSIDSTTSNTFDVTLDSDGVWTIYTTAYDVAGKKQNQNPNNGDWYYQEYTIDTTDPVVTIGEVTSTTNNIILPYTITDNMGTINSKTCKYGTEYLKYTENGNMNDTECVLSGLNKETKYYYQICATDALDNTGCAEGNTESKTISAPVITPSNTPSAAVNGYLKSQTLNVTYSSANITSPTYYIMSERVGRSNVNVIEACGTGVEPGTCSAASTTTISANTWYRVSGNISITYDVTNTTEKQYLYGRTTDGNNIATGTHEISKIDGTGPVNVEASVPTDWTSGNKTITVTNASDANVGSIAGYYISNNTTVPSATATGWQTATTFSKGAGTYNIWAKDSLGNVSASYKTVTVGNIDTANPTTVVLNANSDTAYAKTKSVTVTLKDTGGSGLAAGKFKYGWSTSTSTEPSSYTEVNTSATTGTNETTFTANGSGLTGNYYLWVVPVTYKDNAGRSNTTTVKSTGTFKFDNLGPVVTLSSATVTQNSITVPYTSVDGNVGTIGSTTCAYGKTTSYGSTGTISNGNCVMSGLDASTTYYYKITSIDSLGNSTADSVKTGSATTKAAVDCSTYSSTCSSNCTSSCSGTCNSTWVEQIMPKEEESCSESCKNTSKPGDCYNSCMINASDEYHKGCNSGCMSGCVPSCMREAGC